MPESPEQHAIHIVSPEPALRQSLRQLLDAYARHVSEHAAPKAFLRAYTPGQAACLLLHAEARGTPIIDLLHHLRAHADTLPAIVVGDGGDVRMAVATIKAGALDYIETPIVRRELLTSVERALVLSRDAGTRAAWREEANTAIAALTARQREVMVRVIAGQLNKNIAADLGISQRTVECHRAAIMERTGSTSLPALARLAMAAT